MLFIFTSQPIQADILFYYNAAILPSMVPRIKPVTIEWKKVHGGTPFDEYHGIALDSKGYIYAVGKTNELSTSDAVFSKYDTDGNLIWQKLLNGEIKTRVNRLFGIYIDKNDAIYLVGDFAERGAYIVDPTKRGSTDAGILRFDTEGNEIWSKLIGGSSFDDFYAVTGDDEGNIYAVGSNFARADVDITDGNNGARDALIVKLDTSGNIQWLRTIGGSGTDNLYDVLIDNVGDIVTVGTTDSTDFDLEGFGWPGSGYRDTLTIKLDKDGNVLWLDVLAGSKDDRIASVTIDNANNIYAVGSITSTDGDFTFTDSPYTRALLVKYSPSGSRTFIHTEERIDEALVEQFKSIAYYNNILYIGSKRKRKL